jgi:heat shock protein HspQ
MRRTSKFHVGQLVAHRRLGYRAVVVDVDPVYRENDAWCDAEYAGSARDEPWYRILPDGTAHEAYLAERSLRVDTCRDRIRHPLLWFYFSDFRDGAYLLAKAAN